MVVGVLGRNAKGPEGITESELVWLRVVAPSDTRKVICSGAVVAVFSAGVPETTPVEVFSERPAGSGLAEDGDTEYDLGPTPPAARSCTLKARFS